MASRDTILKGMEKDLVVFGAWLGPDPEGMDRLVRHFFHGFTSRDPVELKMFLSGPDTAPLEERIQEIISRDFFFLEGIPVMDILGPEEYPPFECCDAWIAMEGAETETARMPEAKPRIPCDPFAMMEFAFLRLPAREPASGDGLVSQTKQRTSDFWAKDKVETVRKSLHSFPDYHRRWCERISGLPDRDHFQYFADFIRPLPKKGHFLSIGCGSGRNERGLLARIDPPARFDAFDLSEACVAEAARLAAAAGRTCLNYFVQDVHYLVLPEKRYDLIMAFTSLHHFYNLERVFWEVRKSLAPGGLFIVYDYCGPTRMQFGPEQEHWITQFVRAIPDEWRKRNDHPEQFKVNFMTPTLDAMIRSDYSEGIRSAEIAGLLRRTFRVKDEREAGGTILPHVFSGIENNFNPADPAHVDLIRRLVDMEDKLLKTKTVGHDYRCFVLESPAGDVTGPGLFWLGLPR